MILHSITQALHMFFLSKHHVSLLSMWIWWYLNVSNRIRRFLLWLRIVGDNGRRERKRKREASYLICPLLLSYSNCYQRTMKYLWRGSSIWSNRGLSLLIILVEKPLGGNPTVYAFFILFVLMCFVCVQVRVEKSWRKLQIQSKQCSRQNSSSDFGGLRFADHRTWDSVLYMKRKISESSFCRILQKWIWRPESFSVWCWRQQGHCQETRSCAVQPGKGQNRGYFQPCCGGKLYMSEKLVELASTFLWGDLTFRHQNALEIRFEWVKVCFSAFVCKLCFSSNFAGLPFSIHLELGNVPHIQKQLETPSFISNWNLRHWMLQ